jgi:hypothetical protein
MSDATNADGFLPSLQMKQEQFAPIPICWPMLGEDEMTSRAQELVDWVDWVIDRYALDHRTIPPCWSQHGALLEELSALRTAWVTVYSADSVGDAPLRWHSEFATARPRLTDWVARTGCRPGEHRGDPWSPGSRHERPSSRTG